MAERHLILLVLEVDSSIAHGCQLPRPRQEHHTERHDTSGLQTKSFGIVEIVEKSDHSIKFFRKNLCMIYAITFLVAF